MARKTSVSSARRASPVARLKTDDDIRAFVFSLAARVSDPANPKRSLADLDILRDVKVENGRIEVVMAPPHEDAGSRHLIAMNFEVAVEDAGLGLPRVTMIAPGVARSDPRKR